MSEDNNKEPEKTYSSFNELFEDAARHGAFGEIEIGGARYSAKQCTLNPAFTDWLYGNRNFNYKDKNIEEYKKLLTEEYPKLLTKENFIEFLKFRQKSKDKKNKDIESENQSWQSWRQQPQKIEPQEIFTQDPPDDEKINWVELESVYVYYFDVLGFFGEAKFVKKIKNFPDYKHIINRWKKHNNPNLLKIEIGELNKREYEVWKEGLSEIEHYLHIEVTNSKYIIPDFQNLKIEIKKWILIFRTILKNPLEVSGPRHLVTGSGTVISMLVVCPKSHDAIVYNFYEQKIRELVLASIEFLKDLTETIDTTIEFLITAQAAITAEKLATSNINTKDTTKKLSNPVKRLFCELVNDSKLDVRGDENAEVFCKRVCKKYKLTYAIRVSKHFKFNQKLKDSDKYLQSVIKEILPTLTKKVRDHINSYITTEIKKVH